MLRRVFQLPTTEAELSTAQRYTRGDAFAYCEELARRSAEAFPIASRFVPASLRPYLWAIYAFARTADDFADEPQYAGRRRQALDFWESQLEKCFHGEAEHPVFIALQHAIDERNLPVQPFRDLLTGFSMDLSVGRYATWQTLDCYLQHAAQPLGRLMLYVFDYREPTLHRYSDELCTALQLTNFLRDVGVDLANDRVYLPEEDLRHFGLSAEALFARVATPAFVDLMRYEVAKVRAIYERGRPLLEKVGPELGFELSMIFCAGNSILDKIESSNYDVFARRPQLNAGDKARAVARAATLRWPRFTSSKT
jgi:squalene synthase HpnC